MKRRKKTKRRTGVQRLATEVRGLHATIVRLHEMLARRLPEPLWGATPRPGPSGTFKPYQQYVNPMPVALVTLNEHGDWVSGVKK
jgi:hypothetical protein